MAAYVPYVCITNVENYKSITSYYCVKSNEVTFMSQLHQILVTGIADGIQVDSV